MARNALTIRGLGEKICWMLVQQAMGIQDAKMNSDFMENRVALLLFKRNSLPERLCTTAAVRQMGGTTVYQGSRDADWEAEVNSFQTHLFPILGYFLDCLYVYGFSFIDEQKVGAHNINEGVDFPLINAGSPMAHPAHALADIACMLRVAKSLEGVKAAWIGRSNGTLHSLIASTAWFPFTLSISMPPDEDASALRLEVAKLKTRVHFVESPEETVRDARFIYAGRKSDDECQIHWGITPGLMARADREAKLLLSATPIRAIPVAPEILASKASLLVRQAQYRLCVHKRILHWVFESVRL